MEAAVRKAIRRVREGDRDAFASIVERYEEGLRKIVRYSVKDGSLVDDIIQRSLVKAYFALDRYDESRDFGVWVTQIARNEAVSELRKMGAEKKLVDRYAEKISVEAAYERAATDTEVIDRRMQYVLECIETLPDRSRKLIKLRYTQSEKPIADIARMLKKSKNVITTALSRGRAALEKCIDLKEKVCVASK